MSSLETRFVDDVAQAGGTLESVQNQCLADGDAVDAYPWWVLPSLPG